MKSAPPSQENGLLEHYCEPVCLIALLALRKLATYNLHVLFLILDVNQFTNKPLKK